MPAPDFDAPGDANGDNVYSLEVVASDGGIETVQNVTVTVEEVVPPNNAPVFTSGTTATVAENSTATFYTATATDADGNTSELSMLPVPVPEPGFAWSALAGIGVLAAIGRRSTARVA